MVDRYTKAVLTVIAGALLMLAVQGLVPNARAQIGSGCGGYSSPCFITTGMGAVIDVRVVR